MAGAICGVIVGCLLGMTSLLFLDLEAAERLRRQKDLARIFSTVRAGEVVVWRACLSTTLSCSSYRTDCCHPARI
jgi:hypothetical protein